MICPPNSRWMSAIPFISASLPSASASPSGSTSSLSSTGADSAGGGGSSGRGGRGSWLAADRADLGAGAWLGGALGWAGGAAGCAVGEAVDALPNPEGEAAPNPVPDPDRDACSPWFPCPPLPPPARGLLPGFEPLRPPDGDALPTTVSMRQSTPRCSLNTSQRITSRLPLTKPRREPSASNESVRTRPSSEMGRTPDMITIQVARLFCLTASTTSGQYCWTVVTSAPPPEDSTGDAAAAAGAATAAAGAGAVAVAWRGALLGELARRLSTEPRSASEGTAGRLTLEVGSPPWAGGGCSTDLCSRFPPEAGTADEADGPGAAGGVVVAGALG